MPLAAICKKLREPVPFTEALVVLQSAKVCCSACWLGPIFCLSLGRIHGSQGIPVIVERWLATRGVAEATGHPPFVKRLVKDVRKCASGASVSLHIEKVFQIGVASVRSCAGKQSRLEMQIQTGNSSGLQRV